MVSRRVYSLNRSTCLSFCWHMDLGFLSGTGNFDINLADGVGAGIFSSGLHSVVARLRAVATETVVPPAGRARALTSSGGSGSEHKLAVRQLSSPPVVAQWRVGELIIVRARRYNLRHIVLLCVLVCHSNCWSCVRFYSYKFAEAGGNRGPRSVHPIIICLPSPRLRRFPRSCRGCGVWAWPNVCCAGMCQASCFLSDCTS